MAKLGDTIELKKAASPVDAFIKLRDSKDTVLERFRLALVGPPKEGKTFCAATCSEKYPASLPATDLVSLDDMLWCLLDNGGLDGFAEQRISVPHMDLSTIPAGYIAQGIQAFITLANERIAAGTTKTVVLDSLTALDKLLLSSLIKQYEKWGLYQALLAEHLRYFQLFKSLNCNVIFICHGKYVMPAEDAAGTGKQIASGVTPGTIELNVSGQAADFYRQNLSLIMPVADKQSSGKREFFIYPQGCKGFAGYTRFANLNKEEPAHLGKLFAKIKGNQPAM